MGVEMDCEGFQDALLAAGPSADLGPEGAAHARLCAACAGFLAETQLIAEALRPAAFPPAPRRVRTALFAELRRLHPPRERASWDWRTMLLPPRLVGAVALAAAFALTLYWAPRPRGDGDGLSAAKVYVAVEHGSGASAR